MFEFEELDGNGYCNDVENGDTVARIYYRGMSHEKAREICELDDGCVAYTYSLDHMNTNYDNVVLYSSQLCIHNCENTQWQDNPALIKQAGNVGNLTNWMTAKCYKKRSLNNC